VDHDAKPSWGRRAQISRLTAKEQSGIVGLNQGTLSSKPHPCLAATTAAPTMANRTSKPFIILGSGRSGSTLLRERINSHTAATCYGELFDPSEHDKIYWDTGRPTLEEELVLRREDPAQFLDRFVFGETAKSISAVGFKIFYYQAREGRQGDVWDYLRDQKINILHLRRENMLRQFLSFELARHTKTWFINHPDQAHRDVQVRLEPNECLNFIRSMTEQYRQASEFFAVSPCLETTYEGLANNEAAESSRLLKFLELPQQPLVSGLKKQNVRPMGAVISNYEELEAALVGKPEHAFLDDE
jgi:LPS sulfotransferase NodH